MSGSRDFTRAGAAAQRSEPSLIERSSDRGPFGTVADRVVDALRAYIVDNGLEPGAKLPPERVFLERLEALLDEHERALAHDPSYMWIPLQFELALIEATGNMWLYEVEVMLCE